MGRAAQVADGHHLDGHHLPESYLGLIAEVLKERKTRANATAKELEAVSKQLETLERLREVSAMRLSEDSSLRCTAPVGGESKQRIKFDERVDDDEVLLRLFQEIDVGGNGKIERSELLGSALLEKPENAEMAKVLRQALVCDLEALEEALEPLALDDFGQFKRNTRKESV